MDTLFEIEKTNENKDRKVAGIVSLCSFILVLVVLHYLGYKIPTPPIPQQLLYHDAEMELIPLEAVVEVGTGGGGSGTAVKADKSDVTTPQMTEVLTQHSSSTHVKTGKSNITNTNNPTNNSSSAQNTSNNPFGGGGSGGGDGRGNGTGIGNDNGPGTGPGNGNGTGGNVRRYLTSKPNTTNIQSDEECTIVLSVLVDEFGNIVESPLYVKGKSTSNNMVLINQVIALVKSQAKFNKAPGARVGKEVITLNIKAN